MPEWLKLILGVCGEGGGGAKVLWIATALNRSYEFLYYKRQTRPTVIEASRTGKTSVGLCIK